MTDMKDGGPAFLADLRASFEAHTSGEDKFTRRMAINMADFFGMRPMSLVWQLEKRGFLRRGSWEWFRDNGGITREHEAEARTDRTPAMLAARGSDE
jgi:hypothetical protein